MGKRLQERTKDEKKQWHFVSQVNLCFRNIFLHIPPTVDVWLVSSAFVLLWITAETQRSVEKAERAMQTAQYHQGTVGTTLVSLKAVNRRQNVFQLWSVFKQYKSFCLPNSGLWCLFCFISSFFLTAYWLTSVSVWTFQGLLMWSQVFPCLKSGVIQSGWTKVTWVRLKMTNIIRDLLIRPWLSVCMHTKTQTTK